MLHSIISAQELKDFIKENDTAIIEFKTTWCKNCSK